MAGEYRWHLFKKIVHQATRRLKIRLGGKCVGRGPDGSGCMERRLRKLEFHHRLGKDWRSNRIGQLRRVEIYSAEAAEGLIELLCSDCHRNVGRHPETCFCPKCRERADF